MNISRVCVHAYVCVRARECTYMYVSVFLNRVSSRTVDLKLPMYLQKILN